MILILLLLAAYMTIGVIYFTLTCESTKKVANPIYWLQAMLAWIFLMWYKENEGV